jgi:hypothetical protein
MSDLKEGTAHHRCQEAGRHVCHVPSGRTCLTDNCEQAAGTHWGPLWCPEHDKERLDRISAQLEAILGEASKSWIPE